MELQLWGDNGTQNLKLIKISFKSSWANLGTLLWCFTCICRDEMFFKIIRDVHIYGTTKEGKFIHKES